MRGTDGANGSNQSATPAQFTLSGGLYQFNVVASWASGTVTLKTLGPDNTTWLSMTASFTANGGATLYLAPGQYQVVFSGVTAVYWSIARVPGE